MMMIGIVVKLDYSVLIGFGKIREFRYFGFNEVLLDFGILQRNDDFLRIGFLR